MKLSPALAANAKATTLERVEAGGFDAIVVGAGAAGGLAALLLTEAGLKTLVVDAGVAGGMRRPFTAPFSAMVRSVATPEMFAALPASVSNLGRKGLRAAGLMRQPMQSRCFAWQMDPSQFVDDRDNPYASADGGEFTWFRVRQPGGRMIVPGHGRQYYRLSAMDFRPDDGLSPAWPIRQGELNDWYATVERRLNLSGRRDGVDWTPDSEIANEIAPTPAEQELMDLVAARWPQQRAVLGRFAKPLDALDQAAATGKLHLRRGAIVREIITHKGRATGVAFVDDVTATTRKVSAPLVFLCASTLESTRILMLSGLGRASGALGRNLMDHIVMSGHGQGGALPGGKVVLESGRSVFLPRFDRRGGGAGEGQRGFGMQLYRSSQGAGSYFQAVSFSEMTPRAENRVELDMNRKDRWGVPTLRIACSANSDELARAGRQADAIREIADAAKVKLADVNVRPSPPGMAIHECGTARMGDAPENSVLDPANECWDARGLYVTDASSFPSQGTQNPTLTLMALTARAVNRAIKKDGAHG
ncbi:MAG: GMC family oxidoreductase [Hyphomonadaceae bacterium]|nr:GMC family oxidoreductase [Hyphomonadaceae bacterium]